MKTEWRTTGANHEHGPQRGPCAPKRGTGVGLRRPGAKTTQEWRTGPLPEGFVQKVCNAKLATISWKIFRATVRGSAARVIRQARLYTVIGS